MTPSQRGGQRIFLKIELLAEKMGSLHQTLGLDSDEEIVHVSYQSTGHLLPLCIVLTFPAATLAFVGAVIPWVWYFFVHASHQGQCIVTNRRVFLLGCPGSDDCWYALWHITAIDSSGWPFNTVHIVTGSSRISINHFGNPHLLAQSIRHAKATG